MCWHFHLSITRETVCQRQKKFFICLLPEGTTGRNRFYFSMLHLCQVKLVSDKKFFKNKSCKMPNAPFKWSSGRRSTFLTRETGFKSRVDQINTSYYRLATNAILHCVPWHKLRQWAPPTHYILTCAMSSIIKICFFFLKKPNAVKANLVYIVWK